MLIEKDRSDKSLNQRSDFHFSDDYKVEMEGDLTIRPICVGVVSENLEIWKLLWKHFSKFFSSQAKMKSLLCASKRLEIARSNARHCRLSHKVAGKAWTLVEINHFK